MGVQLSGTDAWKILPPLISRNCDDGLGMGCPGVPTAAVAPLPPPDPPPALASSADVFAPGIAANAVLIGWNPLESAGVATFSMSASWLMYTVRLPGLGWSLIHCGWSPP